jgi:hypothetical protein
MAFWAKGAPGTIGFAGDGAPGLVEKLWTAVSPTAAAGPATTTTPTSVRAPTVVAARPLRNNLLRMLTVAP